MQACCPVVARWQKGGTVRGGAEHVTTQEAVTGDSRGKTRKRASLYPCTMTANYLKLARQLGLKDWV